MRRIILLAGSMALASSVAAHEYRDGNWNWNNTGTGAADSVTKSVTLTSTDTSMKALDSIAQVGECYVTAYVEGSCTKVSKKVMVKEEYVEKSCSDCGALIPKVVKEKIMISPEKTIVEHIPALYENVGEKVLVSPAKSEWKKGNFSQVTKNVDGETYCLVEVPAVYETRINKVLKVPASTRTRVVPAVYKEYEKTIYVPAQQVVKKVPAEYKTIETCVEDKPGYYEWRSVLCEANATPSVLKSIEQKLADGNYLSSAAVDGVINDATTEALKSYQRANGLKVDGLVTMDTVKSMGVKY